MRFKAYIITDYDDNPQWVGGYTYLYNYPVKIGQGQRLHRITIEAKTPFYKKLYRKVVGG